MLEFKIYGYDLGTRYNIRFNIILHRLELRLIFKVKIYGKMTVERFKDKSKL